MAVTVLEHCRVSPPVGSAAEKSLPLTFFDIPWIHFSHIHRLLFYHHPLSKDDFIATVIPSLRESLSLTLKHFSPFAGNLIIPPNSENPRIDYSAGDCVSLIFAESSGDFDSLIGNRPRHAGEFHPLVPQLPPLAGGPHSERKASLFSLQVTLFPNAGVTVAITNHHAVGDARTVFLFMKAWVSITKHGEEEDWFSLAGEYGSGSAPFYDRNVIKDPKGLRAIYLSQIEMTMLEKPHAQTLLAAGEKVRSTFILDPTRIRQLKNLVSVQRPAQAHVSTFAVVCAYVWCCILKSRITAGEASEEDESEHFIFAVDCRARLDPPVPATYFGNCLGVGFAEGKSTQLIGEDGFVIAADLIGEAIREILHNEEGVLKGAETWISRLGAIKNWERIVGVAGSPRFNYYEMDFGWGKPKKFEFVSIDITGSISLNECRDLEGGIEVGLSLPQIQMDAFTSVFTDDGPRTVGTI